MVDSISITTEKACDRGSSIIIMAQLVLKVSTRWVLTTSTLEKLSTMGDLRPSVRLITTQVLSSSSNTTTQVRLLARISWRWVRMM